MVSFSVTLSNVALMLLCLLPGFLLCRLKMAKPEHLRILAVLLLYVCAPCMYADALMNMEYSPLQTARMGQFLVLSLAAEFLLMFLLNLVLGRRRTDFRLRMLTIASVMGNTGFFGLPVIRALFPNAPEVASYSCMSVVALNIMAWTVGIFVLTGDRRHVSFRSALLNPTTVGVAIGIVLYVTQGKAHVPELLQKGMSSFGSMSTPLCMFILGVRLGTMDTQKLFTTPLIYLISACKLVAFPLFCYGAVLLMPLDPVFRASILILGAAPCASVLLNLAELFDHGQELAANCALLSTLLSLLTIPVLSLLL